MTTASAALASMNLILALLLVLSSAAGLHHLRPGRDARLLAVAAVTGGAFAFLAGRFLVAGIDPADRELAAIAVHVVHGGMLGALLAFVRSYQGVRDDE